MDTIRKRFSELIELNTVPSRRYKFLEEQSGISALSWRNAYNGGQRPTAEMLQVVARLWPEYAFWLVTGITDIANGHTSPHGAVYENHHFPRPSATEYFKYRAKLATEIEAINEDRGGKGFEKLDVMYRPKLEYLVSKYPKFFSYGNTYKRISEKLAKLDEQEQELLSVFEREVENLRLARDQENERLSDAERGG